jgi:hypothetical protein
MSQPLTPWRWVGRALATGMGLTLAGWLAGLLGALWAPWLGMVVGALGVLFGGGAWSSSRIGGTGFAAGLIGLIAAIGLSLEGHHAVVARTAPIAEFAGLSAWDPRGEAIALHVGELRHLRKHEAWASQRRGSGKNASTVSTVVTPLFDPAEQRVVGFHCVSSSSARRSNGRWALSSAAWHGGGPVECGAGTKLALASCAKAKVAVAEGATERFVEVFASEEELRGAHELHKAIGLPLGFLFFYALLVVIFRRRGAESVPAPS